MSNKEKELEVIEMQDTKKKAQLEDEVDQTPKKKSIWELVKKILNITLRIIGVLASLYVFIVALDCLSIGFRICLGLQISQLFRSEAILQSPITGLVIGVIVTVVVQSSSASTSIVVSLVASGTIPEVKYAIPIIMGANIGTSVTSTLVALTQAKSKENFGRAFAGGTVHDAFNLLSVIVLLPIEVASGYLEKLAEAMTNSLGESSTVDSSQFDIFDRIKKPVVDGIIQIDKSLMEKYADPNYVILHNETFLKQTCKATYPNGTSYNTKCKYIFGSDLFSDWSETTIGIVVSLLSLAVVVGSLIMISTLLGSLFRGPVSKMIQKLINSNPKNFFLRHSIGYISILIGCIFTMILQSSSVFTSSLVPLVGMGIVSLERVFPLTLGSNIGTTFTGVIAALGQTTNFRESIEIAICHTFFNISGILVWYPIPFLRRAPLAIARYLGERSSEHRWFSIAYLVVVFIITPAILFGLAVVSEILLYTVFGVCVLIVLLLIAFNIVQKKFPRFLPIKLRTWEFLPRFMYSILCRVTVTTSDKDELVTPSTSKSNSDLDDSTTGNCKEAPSRPTSAGAKRTARVAPLDADENDYTTVKIEPSSLPQVDNQNDDNKIKEAQF